MPDLIKKKKIDFVVANGENAADSGRGIIKENFSLLTYEGEMLLDGWDNDGDGFGT